jgi:hypothetical protein
MAEEGRFERFIVTAQFELEAYTENGKTYWAEQRAHSILSKTELNAKVVRVELAKKRK